jgi:hypothetical protein
MDIYEQLKKDMGSLKNAEEEVCGLDSFLTGNNEVRVASMDDFFQFLRVGTDTLIHKAEKDLWRISENQEGEVVIERLFNPDTKEPLRI